MFAIYTPNGRTFTGTLESLRGIDKTTSSNSIRAHQNTDDPQFKGNKQYLLPSKDIQAYKKVINKVGEREVIRHAYQVMSAPIQVLRAENTINSAIKKFKQYSFEEFPILDSLNKLIGTLSRKQLYEYIINNSAVGTTNNKKSIKEIFLDYNSTTYTAEPVTDIRRISALMVEKKLHSVPILESTSTIVGVVTRTDIINAIITDPPLSLWC